jgi:hypothetical protein
VIPTSSPTANPETAKIGSMPCNMRDPARRPKFYC